MLKKTILWCLLLNTNMLFAESTLHIRAFVQGYYLKSSNQMIPIIDRVNHPTVFDTITVELHVGNSGILAYSQKAIFNVNGNATITTPSIYFGNKYFIVLKHRNSIETWSTQPVLITENSNYDFTTGINEAYGNNMILLDNVRSGIYSGDVNQDGTIDLLDMNQIYDSASVFSFGYYNICDLNGDGAADGGDMNFVDNNSNLFVHVISPVFTSHDFIIYPNPAHAYITMNSQTIEKDNVLYIYTSLGALLKTKYNWRNEERIYISSFAAGCYVLQLIDSNHNFTQQLIVEN